MTDRKQFVRRRPELLALEGWYDTGTYRFKLSCRFNDILRCAEFNDKVKHFTSCFRKGGFHSDQPLLRCMNPDWAVIYTPDKHGNFLGRAFVRWEANTYESTSVNEGHLVVDKIYGNRLKFEDIMIMLNVTCRASLRDTYLLNKAS